MVTRIVRAVLEATVLQYKFKLRWKPISRIVCELKAETVYRLKPQYSSDIYITINSVFLTSNAKYFAILTI